VVVGVDVVDVFHAFTDFATVVKLVRKFVVLDRAVAVDVEEIEQDRDVLLVVQNKAELYFQKKISKKIFPKKLDFLFPHRPPKKEGQHPQTIKLSPYLGHEGLVFGVVFVLLVGNAGNQRDKHV
jgi:hypothetical protein